MNNDNYFTVQGWMVNELGLSGNELIAYAIVYGFSQDGESEYHGGKNYLAKSMGISQRTAINVMASLVDKGYVERVEVNQCGVTFVNYKAKGRSCTSREETSWGVKKFQRGGEDFSPNNKNIYLSNKEYLDTNSKLNNKKDILSDSLKKQSDDVIDYLNQQTGQHYRHTPSSEKHIIARLNDGFTVNDCKDVIDKKTVEWLNDEKMQKYLRPETLFGSKFENYLNQRTVPKEQELSYEQIGKMLDSGDYKL